jgi:hypothetical protein
MLHESILVHHEGKFNLNTQISFGYVLVLSNANLLPEDEKFAF